MGDNRPTRGFLVLRNDTPCSYSKTDRRCYLVDGTAYLFDAYNDAREAIADSRLRFPEDEGEHWQIIRVVGSPAPRAGDAREARDA